MFRTLSEIRNSTNMNVIGLYLSAFKNKKFIHKAKIDIQATFQKSPNIICKTNKKYLYPGEYKNTLAPPEDHLLQVLI